MIYIDLPCGRIAAGSMRLLLSHKAKKTCSGTFLLEGATDALQAQHQTEAELLANHKESAVTCPRLCADSSLSASGTGGMHGSLPGPA